MRSPKNIVVLIIFMIIGIYINHEYIKDLKNKNETKDIEKFKKISEVLFIAIIILSVYGSISHYIFLTSNIEDLTFTTFLLGHSDRSCFSPEITKLLNKETVSIPLKLAKKINN